MPVETVKTWTLEVPDWTPPLLNAVKSHWARLHRAVKDAAAQLTVGALNAGVPRVCDHHRPRRRVAVTLYGWARGRTPDPDAPLKVLLDALKVARLIVDDAADWCTWQTPRVVRSAERRTEIVITDLEE